ncbi:unnamed protein product [Brassica rapa subsp. trilocularis]
MEKPRQHSCARDHRHRRCPVTLGAEHPIRKSVRNDKRCILSETVALSYYLPMSSGWVMNSHSSSIVLAKIVQSEPSEIETHNLLTNKKLHASIF